MLKVDTLLEHEGLQLFRKKLKRPLNDVDGPDLIHGAHWTPLWVGFAAASLNQEWISISDFGETIKSGKEILAKLAFDSLFKTLDPYKRGLLYVISTFSPLEFPYLWFQSYFEWINDREIIDTLEDELRMLVEFSLLVEILDTDTYKLRSVIRRFVIAELDKEWDRVNEDVKSIVNSREVIRERSIELACSKERIGLVSVERLGWVARMFKDLILVTKWASGWNGHLGQDLLA